MQLYFFFFWEEQQLVLVQVDVDIQFEICVGVWVYLFGICVVCYDGLIYDEEWYVLFDLCQLYVMILVDVNFDG